MYYNIPFNNPAKAAPLMDRFLRENIGISGNSFANRRRPYPVRSLRFSAALPQVNLSWLGPQNIAGILGYNVYQDNENNRIANINNSETLQFTVALPTGVSLPIAFYVSCYNAFGESIKNRVVATA